MKKKLLITLVIIALLALAGYFFSQKTTDYRMGLSFETKSIHEKNDPDFWKADVEYPKLLGQGDLGLVNSQIEQTALAGFLEFKKNIAEEKVGGNWVRPNWERTYSLKYATSTPAIAPQTIGVYFVEEKDFGGAHPMHAITTEHYNLKSGKKIELANLFTSKDFLKELSNISRKALLEKLGTFANEQEIRSGTEPSIENFSAFVITDKGLRLIFNEYQVAAYAAGIQEVTIAWSELSPILNTEIIKIKK